MITAYASAEVPKGQKETPNVGVKDNGLSKIDERYLDLYVKAGEKFGWEKVGRNIVDDGLNKSGYPAPPEKLVIEKNATLHSWLHPPVVKETTTYTSEEVVYDDTSVSVAPTYSDSGTGWDSVAQCESGGNWSIDTGNGYYGGLQFDSGTWDAYGDPAYEEASDAPMEAQIAAAESMPYDGWPNC